MTPSATALATDLSQPLAEDLVEPGAAVPIDAVPIDAVPLDAVPLDALRSSLDADAGVVLAWLADNAADWGGSDEERTLLLAAAARR